MTQQQVIQKVIDELTINGVVLIFNPHILGSYMEMIYTAGYEANKQPATLKRPVVQMDMNGIELMSYESMRDASRKTGILLSGIGHCLSERDQHRKSAGGYKWKYIEQKTL